MPEPRLADPPGPDLSGNEARYALEAVETSWISSTGAFVERFEREFAAAARDAGRRVGRERHGRASSRDAGARGLAGRRGHRSIADLHRHRQCGAVPGRRSGVRGCRSREPGAWIPPSSRRAITPRTRGIVAVHLYGHPADMDALNDIARRHGLWVVEDAAEAFGATYRGRPVGGLGSIATWSFYGNKILTSGEGGALTVDDPELERRIRLFRVRGWTPNGATGSRRSRRTTTG